MSSNVFNSKNIYYKGDIVEISNSSTDKKRFIKLTSSYPNNLFGLNQDTHMPTNIEGNNSYNNVNSKYYNYTKGYYIQYPKDKILTDTKYNRDIYWSYSDYIYINNFKFLKVFNGYDSNDAEYVSDKGIEIYDSNYFKIAQYTYDELFVEKNYFEGYYIGKQIPGNYNTNLVKNKEWAYSEYISVSKYSDAIFRLKYNATNTVESNAYIEFYDSNKKIIRQFKYSASPLLILVFGNDAKYVRLCFKLGPKGSNIRNVVLENFINENTTEVIWEPKGFNDENPTTLSENNSNIITTYKNITLPDDSFYIRFSFYSKNESNAVLKNYEDRVIWTPSSEDTNVYMNRVDVTLQKLSNFNFDIENSLLYKNYTPNAAIVDNDDTVQHTDIKYAKDFAYSDYIPIQGADKIIFNIGYKIDSTNKYCYELYTQDKYRYKTGSILYTSDTITIDRTRTDIDENIKSTAFLRFTFKLNSKVPIIVKTDDKIILFNAKKDSSENGYAFKFNPTNTEKVVDENWSISKRIIINGYDTVVINNGHIGVTEYCYEIYNHAFKRIKIFQYESTNGITTINPKLIDQDAYFLMFSFENTNKNKVTVYRDNVIYTPYNKKIDVYVKDLSDNIDTIHEGIDDINKNIIYSNNIYGYYFNKNGDYLPDENWAVSKKVIIVGNKKITIINACDQLEIAKDKYIVFYDRNGSLIKTTNYTSNTITIDINEIEKETNKIVYYVRHSYYTISQEDSFIEDEYNGIIWEQEDTYVKNYVERFDKSINDNKYDIKNIKNDLDKINNINYTLGEYMIASDSAENFKIVKDKDWGLSDYIDISGIKKITFYNVESASSSDSVLVIYDENYNNIDYFYYMDVRTIDVLETYKYIRACFRIVNKSLAYVKDEYNNIIYEPSDNCLTESLDNLNKDEAKTIDAENINFIDKSIIGGNFNVDAGLNITLNARKVTAKNTVNDYGLETSMAKIAGLYLTPKYCNNMNKVDLDTNTDFIIIYNETNTDVIFPFEKEIGKLIIIKNIGKKVTLFGKIVTKENATPLDTIEITDYMPHQYMSDGTKWFEI